LEVGDTAGLETCATRNRQVGAHHTPERAVWGFMNWPCAKCDARAARVKIRHTRDILTGDDSEMKRSTEGNEANEARRGFSPGAWVSKILRFLCFLMLILNASVRPYFFMQWTELDQERRIP
jgi:hypothetical protein